MSDDAKILLTATEATLIFALTRILEIQASNGNVEAQQQLMDAPKVFLNTNEASRITFPFEIEIPRGMLAGLATELDPTTCSESVMPIHGCGNHSLTIAAHSLLSRLKKIPGWDKPEEPFTKGSNPRTEHYYYRSWAGPKRKVHK